MKDKKGFTTVELLVVVSIIVILSSMVIGLSNSGTLEIKESDKEYPRREIRKEYCESKMEDIKSFVSIVEMEKCVLFLNRFYQ